MAKQPNYSYGYHSAYAIASATNSVDFYNYTQSSACNLEEIPLPGSHVSQPIIPLMQVQVEPHIAYHPSYSASQTKKKATKRPHQGGQSQGQKKSRLQVAPKGPLLNPMVVSTQMNFDVQPGGRIMNKLMDHKRSELNEYGIPVKDDSKIAVDSTLIDKKFNFWNLPSTAKVLIVSNVPLEIARPRALFHLFSFYGDVNRVKILPHKQNVALVEFRTATMACIARNYLDQVQIKDLKLVVSFSKFGEINMPTNEGNAGFVEDFLGPEFRVLQRYAKDDLLSVQLKRICKPSSCLHINNMPKGMTVEFVKAVFANAGYTVVDIVALRKKKEKPTASMAPSRAMIFIQLSSLSEAIIAMATIGGFGACYEVPAGFRISFTDANVRKEREKTLDPSCKIVVVPNHEPL